ncbi:MAG: hypothetical protein AAB325_05000 [Pseudomonadota bacterium]
MNDADIKAGSLTEHSSRTRKLLDSDGAGYQSIHGNLVARATDMGMVE